jgi:mono/diheme cytochrome c family protein/cytochrome bd-type quinol oxidase subunit 1
MNYPVWDLSFGAGLLIAIVAITHVFVSHFAVGGGLFLVLTERKAYREENNELLEWLKRHTKFFVLVTVVFGAISGVGIWFTIGLIHPSGTSTLIHSYVWGWAIEWVFFFLEITAALLYLYGWNRINRQTHQWLGWIYFITAFASMIIINGIITFMLTPGNWLETREFWQGFFNPTYFPSLFLRFFFALALAGIYALITGSLQKDKELKSKIVKWSARWIVPSFILLPIMAYWYIAAVPANVWESAAGKMPTASSYTNLIIIFSIITFILSLLTLFFSRKVPFVYSLVVLATAFVTMWSFEFIREAIRKPYIIYDYMYVNSIYKDSSSDDRGMSVQKINQNGLLQTAKWIEQKEITPENRLEVGHEIFRVQCQSCHTIDSYRGLKQALLQRGWDYQTIKTRLGSLENMFNKVMPPFAGTEAEKVALAAYLTSLNGDVPPPPTTTLDGLALFGQYCSDCHEQNLDDPLFQRFKGFSTDQVSYLVTKLDSLNEDMPSFEGSEVERQILAKWITEQFQNEQ